MAHVQGYDATLELVSAAIDEAGDGGPAIAAAVHALKQQMPGYT